MKSWYLSDSWTLKSLLSFFELHDGLVVELPRTDASPEWLRTLATRDAWLPLQMLALPLEMHPHHWGWPAPSMTLVVSPASSLELLMTKLAHNSFHSPKARAL